MSFPLEVAPSGQDVLDQHRPAPDRYPRKLPDGTVIFTSPTGHTHTTELHGGTLFPSLKQPTGELGVPDTDRGVMMPNANKPANRTDATASTKNAAREPNSSPKKRQRQAWLAANYEPPPF